MFDEKEYSPYRGLLVSCFMLIIFPFCLMLLFSYVLRNEYIKFHQNSIFVPIFFGSLCGNIYHLILLLSGVFKKPFMIEVKRIKNFFSDVQLSFKIARREFIHDAKESKMVFWIYFGIIFFFIILTIVSLLKILN